jgi:hypothetical protein
MALQQVWDDKIHLFLGELIYTHLYVYVDTEKMNGNGLETAFTFQADVRVGGADLWTTGQVPLKNSAITAAPTAPVAALGSVEGEIDDWGFAGASWASATAVNFLVVAKADLSVPLRALPGIAGIVIGLIGSKVRITVGHENVSLPIRRGAGGSIISINNTSLAAVAVG